MPPIVASLLCLGLIAWFFRRDIREKPNVTSALWLPTLWLLIIGSRSFSQWLDMYGWSVGGASLEEGSPVDAAFYFALIVGGAYVLIKRRVSLKEVISHNRWLAFFLIYCLVSVLWSDFPFVSFKRWIKILGHPIMALVLFTEPDPEESFIRLMKRSAYVLLPVSILFIKYYPQWGRQFDPWSGSATSTGITTDKNSLGCICLILGFFFFWQFQKTWKLEKTRARRNELLLCGFFFVMVVWLLKMARSSTSMLTLFIAMLTVLFLGLRFVDKRRLGFYLVTGIVVLLVAQFCFGLSDMIIASLGKDPTLTDRTKVWRSVLQVPINPIVGTGFETFWLGERRDRLWKIWWWQPVQAHNGYLETYLNLGLIGLGLMVILILSAFWKGSKMLFSSFEFARFRLGFLAAFVLYNWTEAAFKALHPVWFIFYLISIDLPKPLAAPIEAEIVVEDEMADGLKT